MAFEVNFGTVAVKTRPVRAPGGKFRLAVLGDFSGRANAGKLDTGAALAKHKPIRVDVDNLDDVIARMGLSLRLRLDGDDQAVDVPIASLDDFHPDQLLEGVTMFEALLTLRRNLSSRAGFDRAAREVLSWGGEAPIPPAPRQARGAAIATGAKLSDFARLAGRPAAAKPAESAADDLVKRLVGPFIQPSRDARQPELVARVDEALSAALRRILHDPDFQAAEAVWRGIEFLVRRIATGARMEIVLYDVSAEELAADLARDDKLEESGLYGMLVEQPALDAQHGPFTAIVGLYGFELTPPHAELLGRVAQLAAAAGAPFLSAIGPDALRIPMHEQHPLIKQAWGALQELQAAAYLGLATPRFLLRMPYGRKSEPIDAFPFEEFTRQSGLSGMLWGHAALIPALLLAQGWARDGAKLRPGAIMGVGDVPYYTYDDPDGEQVALPCTERLYAERQAVQVGLYRVMPLLSLRGRPELRLGSFTSQAGQSLAGIWAPVEITAPPPPVTAPPAPPPSVAPQVDTIEPDSRPASVETAAKPEPEPPPPEAAAEDDLDALLASLNAPAPEASTEATEPDLDALLASL